MPNMRATDFDSWMETAVGEVLESMCFLSSVGQVSSEIGDAGSIACRLNFIGDPNGSFGVRAPEATSRLIAANFLGEDEQALSSEQVVGVMCEIANMICGAILNHLNPICTFSLSSPVREPQTGEPEGRVEGNPNRVCRTYALDEGTLHTWFAIEAAS